MAEHHYLQPQNLMYNGYLQLSQTPGQTANDTSIVQMRTLREQLNQIQAERDQLQKELNHERQQKLQLQNEFQKSVTSQNELNYQCMTLRLEVAKFHQQHQQLQTLQQQQELLQQRHVLAATTPAETEEEAHQTIHVCPDCQFETKSQVSLFLHKMNHNLGSSTPKHLHLPTRMWTTKSESAAAYGYKCPACDDSVTFSRHEIYPHIYQFHSSEQPLKCPICLLYFTHEDYLNEHKFDKHKIGFTEPSPSNSGRGRGRNVSRGSKSKQSLTTGRLQTGPTKNFVKCEFLSTMSTVVSTPVMTCPPVKRKCDSPDIQVINEAPKKSTTSIVIAKDEDELSCNYPGCGFTAPSKDRLQFHMQAHTMSKYKCPYCAYVGNILVDIRRHILKSKKHEGLNVFQCIKCDYGSDCERTYKDHLKRNHFGMNVDDSVLEEVLESLFLNESNQQQAV